MRDRLEKVVVASSMSIYGEGLYRCPSTRGSRSRRRRARTSSSRAREWELALPVLRRSRSSRCRRRRRSRSQPASIYAVGKRDHEEMFLAWGRAYRVPATALRFFNVYGPRQALSNPYTGVAAIFASRLLNGRPPVVFEDGAPERATSSTSRTSSPGVAAALEPGAADRRARSTSARARPVSVLDVAEALGAAGSASRSSRRSAASTARATSATASPTSRSRAPSSATRRGSAFEEGMRELVGLARRPGGATTSSTRRPRRSGSVGSPASGRLARRDRRAHVERPRRHARVPRVAARGRARAARRDRRRQRLHRRHRGGRARAVPRGRAGRARRRTSASRRGTTSASGTRSSAAPTTCSCSTTTSRSSRGSSARSSRRRGGGRTRARSARKILYFEPPRPDLVRRRRASIRARGYTGATCATASATTRPRRSCGDGPRLRRRDARPARRARAGRATSTQTLFFYVEDTDWSLRARARRAPRTTSCRASRVHHKVSVDLRRREHRRRRSTTARATRSPSASGSAPLGRVRRRWRRRASSSPRTSRRRCARRSGAEALRAVRDGWRDFRRGRLGSAAPDGRAEQLLRADARGAGRARRPAARHARPRRRGRAGRPRRLPGARLHRRHDHRPRRAAPTSRRTAWERQDAEALHVRGRLVRLGRGQRRPAPLPLAAPRAARALPRRAARAARARGARLGADARRDPPRRRRRVRADGGRRQRLPLRAASATRACRTTSTAGRSARSRRRSARPRRTRAHEFLWFHELELPLSVLEVGGGRRRLGTALRALQPAARLVARVAPGQANLFAFAVLKSDELQPWLRPGEDGPVAGRGLDPPSPGMSALGMRLLRVLRPPGDRRGDERGRCSACGAETRFVLNSWLLPPDGGRRVGRVGGGVRAPRDDDLLALLGDAARAAARRRAGRALRAGRGLRRGAGRGARLPRARTSPRSTRSARCTRCSRACRSSGTPSTVPRRCRART